MPRRHAAIIALIALFLIFKVAVIPYAHNVEDDANLYAYMARLVSEGEAPYRDFVFASPPLMLYLAAGLFAVFGASYPVALIIPVLAGAGTLLLTYLIGEKMKKHLGIAAAVLLFCSPAFQETTHWFGGASLNTFLLVLAFYLTIEKKFAASGFSLVLAGIARYTSFPAMILLLVHNLYKRRAGFFKGAILASPLVAMLLLTPNFLRDTVLYHFSKQGSPLGVGLSGFYTILAGQPALVLFGLFAGALYLRSGKRNERMDLVCFAALSAFLWLLLPTEVLSWYISYSLPFFALLSGYAIFSMVGGLKSRKREATVLILLIICISLAYPMRSIVGYKDTDTFTPFYQILSVQPEDTLYDTSASIAAHLALLSGAEIADNLVDVSPRAYAAALIDPEEVASRVRESKPKYIFDARYSADRGVSSDFFWRQSSLRDFLLSNYSPAAVLYRPSTAELIIAWGPQQDGVYFNPNENPALYSVEYIASYSKTEGALNTKFRTERAAATRQSLPGDLRPSSKFVGHLNAMSLDGKPLLLEDSWAQQGASSHWRVSEGHAASETWVRDVQGTYYIFTETSYDGVPTAFIIMDYSPEVNAWVSLTAYQHLSGSYVLLYKEGLVAYQNG
ncbi:MAG: hypothetical protein ABH829_00615 [archaeon]